MKEARAQQFTGELNDAGSAGSKFLSLPSTSMEGFVFHCNSVCQFPKKIICVFLHENIVVQLQIPLSKLDMILNSI